MLEELRSFIAISAGPLLSRLKHVPCQFQSRRASVDAFFVRAMASPWGTATFTLIPQWFMYMTSILFVYHSATRTRPPQRRAKCEPEDQY